MVDFREKLTLQEVAHELGRSLEQVRRYVREGKLPAEKLGMQWFVQRSALIAFQGTHKKKVKEGDLLLELRALREEIREKVGRIDVLELLEESRGSRP